MRQKRAKAYKRLMTLYSQTFGFRQPFQVLVTHDFLLELSKKQLDATKQLSHCVQGECKPMITQCSIEALYKLGKEYQPVVDIAKGFERRRCNHREAVAEDICIKETVGPTNKHRYTMAMQNGGLRAFLRNIPGVPIIHFNDRGVMVLEMPSDATERYKAKLESSRMTEQLVTHATLPNIVSEAGPSTINRRKAAKAPNPLSLKKKKVDKDSQSNNQLRAPRLAKGNAEPGDSPDGSNSNPRKRRRSADSEGMDEPTINEIVPAREKEQLETLSGSSLQPTLQADPAGDENKKRKRKRKRKTGGEAGAQPDGEDGDGSD